MTNENINKENGAASEAKEAPKKKNILKRPWVQSTAVIVVVFGALAGFLYWQSVKDAVFIENSYLEAPTADMSPSAPGVLNAIYVKEGDRVAAGQQVALIGS